MNGSIKGVKDSRSTRPDQGNVLYMFSIQTVLTLKENTSMQSPSKRPLTWEEQVQWVMKNTNVEWENLYIVEEIAKSTTPTHVITSQIGEEIVRTYEYNNKI